jgi:hypothetical protein
MARKHSASYSENMMIHLKSHSPRKRGPGVCLRGAVFGAFAKALLTASLCFCAPTAEAARLDNDRYTVELTPAKEMCVSVQAAGTWTFRPEFTVLQSEKDPRPALRPGGIRHVPYNVLTWKNNVMPTKAALKAVKPNAAAAGDGFDDRILEGDTQQRTADVFSAAPLSHVRADSAELRGQAIHFGFPEQASYKLEATLILPPGNAAPLLSFTFTPKVAGFYSIAYSGAPSFALSALTEVWQPFVWQGKRFPDKSYVTPAFECSLPATLVMKDKATIGVVVDSSEFAFQPLPLLENSRFGVALRNAAGEAQPMVFAPLLGGVESKMKAGAPFTFKLRLVAAPGSPTDAYEMIARELYSFRDYRRNAIASLNETLDNMIDYGLSHYSWFIEELKGCAYSTDVPGAVKNVSSLNPLEFALVADDEEIFDKRVYPIVEFLLSREKFLFSLDPAQKIQSPSRALKGPCAPVSELAALYGITRGASPLFLSLAEQMFAKNRVLNLDDLSEGGSWQNALALYESTGDRRFLERARRGADDYIRQHVEKPAVDFNERGLFFWTAFAPKWIDLMRLHEATGERRYLDAAREGARRFAQFIWMSPAIPDESVLVNKGGKAPVYWYLQSRGFKPMSAPEGYVPAWRLSEIGLTPESSGTMSGHRAIFMASHAAWMMRIASKTGDSFLRDIARSAIVGRYRNFPGYHINTERTDIYERADYPLHEHTELSVNSFHYNHIWPHMTLLFDFLMADVADRSHGRIDFPGRFVEGYAYLQNQLYGDRLGTFYGHEDAQLWMPRRLLKSGSVELNYLCARGQKNLYLAFSNQSPESVTTDITLNSVLLPQLKAKNYRLRVLGREEAGTKGRTGPVGDEAPGEVCDGHFTVSVAPMGLTAVVIEELTVVPRFQPKLLAADSVQSWGKDYAELALGNTRALILNFGPGEQKAFIYLQADDRNYKEVTLLYDNDGSGTMHSVVDNAYPFEFTLPLGPGTRQLRFQIRATALDGTATTSTIGELHK